MARNTTALGLLLATWSLTTTGCFWGLTTQGPSLGILAIPIPVSPYFQDEKEDEYWEHERYERVPILGPVTSGGVPVAQIEAVLRASDPLYEIGMMFFGHRQEDRFWRDTLANLAAFFGVRADAEMHRQLLSRRYQWSNAGNLVSNGLIRGALFRSTAPFTRLARRFRRQSRSPVKEQIEA